MDLLEFLTLSKKQTNEIKETENFWKVVFCVGNEACDIDSTVCAIVAAYEMSLEYDETFIPIMNGTRKHLRLRRDVRYVMESVGIDMERDLVFLDDVEDIIVKYKKRIFDNKEILDENRNVSLMLVDHNKPKGVWAGGLKIIAVFDHHDIEDPNIESGMTMIKNTASCSSIIYERFGPIKSPEAKQLLLFAILRDLIALSKEDEDILIVRRNDSKQDVDTVLKLTEDCSMFIDSFIRNIRENTMSIDLSKMSLAEIMYYDLKSWATKYRINFCMSSVCCNRKELDSLYDRTDVLKTMRRMGKTYKLVCLLLVDSKTSEREVIFYSDCSNIIDEIKKNSSTPRIFETYPEIFKGYFLSFYQSKEMSRKRYMPILQKILEIDILFKCEVFTE
eukprot:GHVP01040024.1.p1 GENE.GHVP01040024.1~~GHVP01040024.1.p1  ORF type:complete len:390 (-),score=65.35 GHVP01040024.1:69-1238(-)